MSDTVTVIPKLLTIREVAEVTGLSVGTLYNKKLKGTGPRFVKRPGSSQLLCREEDLIEWMLTFKVSEPVKTRQPEGRERNESAA